MAALAIGFVAYGDYSDAAGVVQKKTLAASKQVRKVKALQQAAEKAANDGLALKVAVDRAFLPAQSYADIVTVTTRDVPSSVWLSGLTFERGKPLLIRGTSKTNSGVADFLGALSKEDRFREVKLVFANNSMIEKTPVVQFSISAFPIGNLPAVDTAKKMPVPTAPKPPTGGNV